MHEKIHLYYTNDLHSDFTHWPKVASFLKTQRNNCEKMGISSFLFDVGDHVDRVHPIAEAFKGKANVQLLNELEYDGVTIGNNEGITLAEEDLYTLYDQAQFDVIVSNMQSMNGQRPAWLKRVATYETAEHTRIGVVGLTAPFNPFYHLLGWHIDDPAATLGRELERLKEEVDVIVLLSHLGLYEDRELARQFPEIDVIIGGHTHHLLQAGEVVDETILTAAGKHCSYVGEVILSVDGSKQIVKKEAAAIQITHLDEDKDTAEALAIWDRKATILLEEPVVTLEETIPADPFVGGPFLDHFTETLLEWTKADCAMLNNGLLVETLPKGLIMYKDIHRVCPHPINPCVVQISGRELIEVVRATFSDALTTKELKGFGFRGDVIGAFSYANIDIQQKEGVDDYIYNVHINGQPVDKDETYHLATVDMFTFGRLLPEIARSPAKAYFLPEMIRDVLMEALKTYV